MTAAAESVVAIDGPGGVGKTTVSRGVARALGYRSLDTGAFYRAAALLVKFHRIDPEDEAAVLAALSGADLDYRDGAMLVEGVDVSAAIRAEGITAASSRVARLPGLRLVLVERQRAWVAAREGRAVVEGRDIGTVVFPGAAVKIYLDAPPDVRARRRAGETSTTLGEVATQLGRRDRLDSTRAASPLARAQDALAIDTGALTADQVIARVLELCRGRGIEPAGHPA
ncbi:MAG: (d)CMP kinase [bacterium]|nr:(d)CMP kinase [bacterium]MDE0352988.1 (d)CMP kinase [bacterium]